MDRGLHNCSPDAFIGPLWRGMFLGTSLPSMQRHICLPQDKRSHAQAQRCRQRSPWVPAVGGVYSVEPAESRAGRNEQNESHFEAKNDDSGLTGRIHSPLSEASVHGKAFGLDGTEEYASGSTQDLKALVGKLQDNLTLKARRVGDAVGEIEPVAGGLRGDVYEDEPGLAVTPLEGLHGDCTLPAHILADLYLDKNWDDLDETETEESSDGVIGYAPYCERQVSESSIGQDGWGLDGESLHKLVSLQLSDETDVYGLEERSVAEPKLNMFRTDEMFTQTEFRRREVSSQRRARLNDAHARIMQRRHDLQDQHGKTLKHEFPSYSGLSVRDSTRFTEESRATSWNYDLSYEATAMHSSVQSSPQHAVKSSKGEYLELPFEPVDRLAEATRDDIAATLKSLESVPLASAKLPKCKRCNSPSRDVDLDRTSQRICAQCYRQIYLVRESTASLGDQDPHGRFRSDAEKAQVVALEEGVAAAARQVTLSHIANRVRTRVRDGSSLGSNPISIVANESSNMPDSDSGWRAYSQKTAEATASKAEASRAARKPHGAGLQSRRSFSDEMGGDGDANVPGLNHRIGDDAGHRWNVRASDRSLRTINPIRQLVQGIAGKPNPEKELIDLSVGDPTRFGNLKVGDDILDEFCSALRSGKHNGYTESMGTVNARRAVSTRYSLPLAPITEENVFLTSGVSGALELALGSLANEGDNVLLPQPGFPLFKTILDGFGVESRYYQVLPDRSWEIQVSDFSRLADERTAAIVINNPSNPCGSVFSASHLKAVVDAAAELRLPIVADEVYADMVFRDEAFTSTASMSQDVPVLSVGGISKQFVVPGWRLGWLLVHDRNGILQAGRVQEGIRKLTTRMLLPNAPTQAVLPHMLEKQGSDLQELMETLQSNADALIAGLSGAVGIRIVRPQGSMYLMIEVDVDKLGFADDLAFAKALRLEESVFVLPGACFQAPNFVRIVFCAPPHVLRDAASRIKEFCARHAAVRSSVAFRKQD